MSQCHKCDAFCIGKTDPDTGHKDADFCCAVPQEANTDNEEAMLIILEGVLFTLAEMGKCPQFIEARTLSEPSFDEFQVDVPGTRDIYPAVSDAVSDFAFDAAREDRIFGK